MADFLVNTHYQTPWIIWKTTLNVSVSPHSTVSTPIPHGLPFIPLLMGQWSESSDFNFAHDIASYTPTNTNESTWVYATSDSTNVTVTSLNATNSTKTFYYRLMGLAYPDFNGPVNPIEYPGHFRYNSHYRYQQIYESGVTAQTSVRHNLGYIPQARVWQLSNGVCEPSVATIDNSYLYFPSGDNIQYVYHIYKDRLR